jgi:hypothetical protein
VAWRAGRARGAPAVAGLAQPSRPAQPRAHAAPRRPTALAVLLLPAGERTRSAAPSFGELMLVPKSAAPAQPVGHTASAHQPAGYKTHNGKKTSVKSGYRGVRQRPWGAWAQAVVAAGGHSRALTRAAASLAYRQVRRRDSRP